MDIYAEDWSPGADLDRDKDGGALREMLGALRQSQALLKTQLDRGVPPDDFKRGQALMDSYEAARQGLEKAWGKRHGG
ncbi:MAG: hypothetical protein LBV15_00860 [Planctomycetota bacterium]|jgi:hypothetical protein|nr:hypothetical protein [Planctomycetota bacterium]